MGFVSGLFSGDKGSGYVAKGADLMSPVNMGQAGDANANAALAAQQLQNYASMVNNQGQGAIANQNMLADQLAAQTRGEGPNPAQAMLNQNTAANIQNQAALAASQRGSSANAGLIARLAGQQGAGIQQNAIGQAATLGANQQLAAQQALANLAGTQLAQGFQARAGANQAAQGLQQNILGAINQQNQAQIGNLSQYNSANAGVAQQNAKAQASGVGGVFNSLGSATGLFAEGGQVGSDSPSAFSQYFMAKGGKVPVMLSPGEKYIPPSEVKKVAAGKANPIEVGKKVPGKPKVKGDSLKNDVFPAKLETGGIVIPNSVLQSKNPAKNAQKFVAAILAKQAPKRAA